MFKLRILDLLAVIAATLTGTAYVWTQNAYRKIATNTPIAIDRYVGETEPAFTDKLQCVLVHYTAKWAKTIHQQPFPIVADQHRFIHGLKRTRAAQQSEPPTQSDKPKPPLVIGTIRKYLLTALCTADHSFFKGRFPTSLGLAIYTQAWALDTIESLMLFRRTRWMPTN